MSQHAPSAVLPDALRHHPHRLNFLRRHPRRHSDSSGKFFGYVKDSSDTRVVPVGVPVEVDVMNASDYSYLSGPPDHTAPGRVVTVSINGDHVGSRDEGHQLGDQVPFCDAASAHKSVCGA